LELVLPWKSTLSICQLSSSHTAQTIFFRFAFLAKQGAFLATFQAIGENYREKTALAKRTILVLVTKLDKRVAAFEQLKIGNSPVTIVEDTCKVESDIFANFTARIDDLDIILLTNKFLPLAGDGSDLRINLDSRLVGYLHGLDQLLLAVDVYD
jgi:hypothetical protein